MNECTERNFRKRQSVAEFRSNARTGSYGLSYLKSVWSYDVPLLAVLVYDKCYACAAVRIILDGLYLGGIIVLVTTEVDYTIHPLVATADIAHGHLTLIVTSAGLAKRLQQGFLRDSAGYIIKSTDNFISLTGSDRFEFSYCHCL